MCPNFGVRSGAFNGSGRSFVNVTTNGTTLFNTFTSTDSGIYLNDIMYNGKYLITAGFNHSIQAAQIVPEPSTYTLFGLGAIGMLMVMRRKKTA